MKYYHDSIDQKSVVLEQCRLAKLWYIIKITSGTLTDSARRLALADTLLLECGDHISPSEFDATGFPFLQGMSPILSNYLILTPDSLRVDDLRASFAKKQPVIFQWQAQGISNSSMSGAHDMVAEGSSSTRSAPKLQWVSVNDPWPLDSTELIGRHAQIAYSEFKNTSHAVTRISDKFEWCRHGYDYVISRK